jgi:O-Antigen ligase
VERAHALGPPVAARRGPRQGVGSAMARWLRDTSPRHTLAGLAFGIALGWAVVAQPKLAAVLLALGACLAAQALGVRRLVLLLIVTTFVTRFRVVVGGYHFMPEHVVLLIALLSLAMSTRLDRVWAALRSPAVLLLGLFVAWGGVVSLMRAPQQSSSLAIVGWLALDWLILVLVLATVEDSTQIERVGSVAAVGAAAVAIFLWGLSSVGLIAFGTQHETLTGAPAAYGLSFEANILASTLAIWLFLILTGARSTRFRVAALCLLSCALVLSLTRAAIIGLLLGLVVWAVFEGKVARRRVLRSLAAAAVAIAALSVLAPSVSAPFTRKIAEATDFSSGTGHLRVQSWSTAVGDIHGPADVLLGLGTNTFGQRHLDPTVPELDRGYYLGNLPLEIFYDTGLVGVLLILGALATMRPLAREHPGRAAGLIVLYLVCSMATSTFWFGSTWLLIAMALRRRRTRAPAPAPSRAEVRPAAALADAGMA